MRSRLSPRLRLRVGAILLVLALVPLLGLGALAAIQVSSIVRAQRQLDQLDAASNELLTAMALEAAIVDENYWNEASITVRHFGIPSSFVETALGINPVGRFESASEEVDRLLEQIGDEDLTAAIGEARNPARVAPMMTPPLGAIIDGPIRGRVSRLTAEVIAQAASLDDGSDLVHSAQVLQRSAALRASVDDVVGSYFFLAVFGDVGSNRASNRLSGFRAVYDERVQDEADLIVETSEFTETWANVRDDQATIDLMALVDEILAQETVISIDSIEDFSLDNLGGIVGSFTLSHEATAAHLELVDHAGDDLTAGAASLRDAERQRARLLGLSTAAITVVTIVSVLFATRSIASPLRDLARSAESLRSGDDLTRIPLRGPKEVRSAARTLNEAMANLRRAEGQALALADGRLDDDSFDEVASGRLGESLSAAVARLRMSLTEREEYRRRLAHEASHDGLTGLSNRSATMSHLTKALARSERSDTTVAVLFIDLDGFKQVNDLRGHMAGDRLLQHIARRLVNSCREGDLVGRLGGDEFLVIAEPVADAAEALDLADRLRQAVGKPLTDDGQTTLPRASVGVALASGRETASELIRDADLAVYEAKQNGRDRTELCDERFRARILKEADLELAVRSGLVNDEFELNFQTIVDSTTKRVVGVEALLRWDRPDFGRVPPDEFIEFSERSDLIIEIDRWVLNEAMRHLAGWAADSALADLSLAVNISGRHFLRGDLYQDLASAIDRWDIDPSLLIVEITESALLDDLAAAGRILGRLRERGIRIAIDDFGTGYTSLAHLRSLHVDVLKVDRSFTANLHVQNDLSLVNLIIETGHLLGMSVIVEGVETDDQIAVLRDLNADKLQGFRFSRPMDAADLAVHVRQSLVAAGNGSNDSG